MEENKLPTPAIIKSTLSLEASRVNYQKVLQHISNVTITRDNVNENHTKEIKDIIKALEKKKEEINRPLLDAQKATVKALKEICDPLQEQIDRIAGETKTIALAIKSENDKQILEQNRVNIAKSAIVSFVNQVAVDIANAKTDADIVLIEKRIGSEGTKTSVYAEFISELTLACEDLRPMIKKQKENIRTLQDIEVREKLALERGDIVTATSLMGQKEYMGQLIEETGMRIHEKAFEQASVIDIVVPEIMDTAPKGRTNWKWEVSDIKTLNKKLPHCVELTPIKAEIEKILATRRADGSLKDKDEEIYCGIRFFNDKGFK